MGGAGGMGPGGYTGGLGNRMRYQGLVPAVVVLDQDSPQDAYAYAQLQAQSQLAQAQAQAYAQQLHAQAQLTQVNGWCGW